MTTVIDIQEDFVKFMTGVLSLLWTPPNKVFPNIFPHVGRKKKSSFGI